MCDTCPAHIPGPGEVAGKVARSRIGRKVGRKALVGFCYLMFPFAVWNELHWWTLAVVATLAALAAAVHGVVRVLHRSAVLSRPEPTPQMRAALAARGLRPIPAPGRVARPALPRAMVRSLTGRRQALPAPARALPGVVTGKVVPAPVRGKVVR
jgi:hypothetical protein